MREREVYLAFSYKYKKQGWSTGTSSSSFQITIMMVAQDNNILCITPDSNTHDRTKNKIKEDRLFGAVAINIFNKFRIITDIRKLQFATNIRKVTFCILSGNTPINLSLLYRTETLNWTEFLSTLLFIDGILSKFNVPFRVLTPSICFRNISLQKLIQWCPFRDLRANLSN